MKKTIYIMLLVLVMLISACVPTSLVPTISKTATFRGMPSPTATIRPTPSQTSTPHPFEAVEIAHLGGPLKPYALVSSPNGKTYTVSDETGLHLYDSGSKKEIHFFPTEYGVVQYSPNSQMILAMGFTTTTLIQLSDNKVVGKFKKGYQYMPTTFSPDSKRFAYLTDCSWFYEPECKEIIHVWDITTRQEVFKIKAQSVVSIFRFFELAFDPTGAFLLASDSKGVIHVWNASNGKVAFNLQSPTGIARPLVFSHDGKYLASLGDDTSNFTILLWNWDSKERRTVTGKYSNRPTFIRNMTFSVDDSHIDLIFDDDSTMIWDLTSGKLSQGEKFINQDSLRLQQMRERGEYIANPESMAYSPDGQTLAVGGFFLSPIVLWDTQTKKVRATLDGKATQLQYNHRGNRLIVLYASLTNMTEEDSDVTIWDTEHNLKLHTFKIPLARTFDISPDDSTLAIDSLHATQLWDIEKGTWIQNLPTPGLLESPYSVSYSADGKLINTVLLKDLGQREYELSILSWDASTGKQLLASLPPIHLGNSDGVLGLHHNTLALFQYAPDTQIGFWDVKSGKKIQTLEEPDYFNPPRLFFTSNDQIVSIDGTSFYNILTGKTIYHSDDSTDTMAFSADGKQFASFDGDGASRFGIAARFFRLLHQPTPNHPAS